jgi:hypothetical protein
MKKQFFLKLVPPRQTFLMDMAFDDRIRKLLDFLERDIDGVRKLANVGEGQIQVASIFHNGNTMLGGFHLDRELLKRLSSLEVEIDFDLYAKGRKFLTDRAIV